MKNKILADVNEKISLLEHDRIVDDLKQQIEALTERVEQLSGIAKEEQLRAWAIDRAIEFAKAGGDKDIITKSDEIISYVKGSQNATH